MRRRIMTKTAFVVIICTVLVLIEVPASAEKPSAARKWIYLNLNTIISPGWSWLVMPGYRYEFIRNNDTTRDSPGVPDTKESYFWELVTGPTYTMRAGDLTLKLPVWYLYMGFPNNATEKYFYSHNIEVAPTIEYRTGRTVLSNRVILFNKLYAHNNVYTDDQYSGYSLLIREKFQVTWGLTKEFALILADEIFFGVIEDEDTKNIVTGEPFFAKKGFRKNRIYAGGACKLGHGLSLSLQYIYETNYNPDNGGDLTERDHYILTTLSYVMKLF